VATFIIDIICQVVEKMGSEHIAHVVNTNLAMWKNVGYIIEGKDHYITYNGCKVHIITNHVFFLVFYDLNQSCLFQLTCYFMCQYIFFNKIIINSLK
jgi:hypothetical protein